MEFGWWRKDPGTGKFQVRARFHGGNVDWDRKQGHHKPWEQHLPSPEDWEQLLFEAEKRMPRRLMSPRQFEQLKALCDRQ